MNRSAPFNNIFLLALSVVFMAQLSGCASIAKGITQAVVGEKEEKVDTRECHIRGRSFDGLEAYMERQERIKHTGDLEVPTLKVLMVHGIGKHLPGYSTRLAENLSRELRLDVVKERVKEIQITQPVFPNEPLGLLRVSFHSNKSGTRRMMFYELTWSEITDAEKQAIAYDDSGAYSFRRANLNNAMKKFINSHIPDPLIYLGESREKIQISVGQSICWMYSRNWEGLDDKVSAYCDPRDDLFMTANNDDYAFITHSLGSRIVTDSLQRIATIIEQFLKKEKDNNGLNKWLDGVQQREFPLFMLANQLTLLELGRAKPEVIGQFDQYCLDNSQKAHSRLFKELSMVAFNDPNDLLSWAVPPTFIDGHMDSRLCPTMVNVIINIAEVIDVLGLGKVANPAVAHGGYDNDERVIGLISKGIGNGRVDKMVAERCVWTETQ